MFDLLIVWKRITSPSFLCISLLSLINLFPIKKRKIYFKTLYTLTSLPFFHFAGLQKNKKKKKKLTLTKPRSSSPTTCPNHGWHHQPHQRRQRDSESMKEYVPMNTREFQCTIAKIPETQKSNSATVDSSSFFCQSTFLLFYLTTLLRKFPSIMIYI